MSVEEDESRSYDGPLDALQEIMFPWVTKVKFLRYGEKMRESPMDKKTITDNGSKIKELKLLQDNLSFPKDFLKSVLLEIADARSFDLDDEQEDWAGKMTKRVHTMLRHFQDAFVKESKWAASIVQNETDAEQSGEVTETTKVLKRPAGKGRPKKVQSKTEATETDVEVTDEESHVSLTHQLAEEVAEESYEEKEELTNKLANEVEASNLHLNSLKPKVQPAKPVEKKLPKDTRKNSLPEGSTQPAEKRPKVDQYSYTSTSRKMSMSFGGPSLAMEASEPELYSDGSFVELASEWKTVSELGKLVVPASPQHTTEAEAPTEPLPHAEPPRTTKEKEENKVEHKDEYEVTFDVEKRKACRVLLPSGKRTRKGCPEYTSDLQVSETDEVFARWPTDFPDAFTLVPNLAPEKYYALLEAPQAEKPKRFKARVFETFGGDLSKHEWLVVTEKQDELKEDGTKKLIIYIKQATRTHCCVTVNDKVSEDIAITVVKKVAKDIHEGGIKAEKTDKTAFRKEVDEKKKELLQEVLPDPE